MSPEIVSPAPAANASGRSPDRIASIDLLRGIAALAVVLFHYTTRYQQLHPDAPSLPFSFPYGHYGVTLFFVISGFVICMTIERCRTAQDFVVSRLSRLYPVFWVCALLTYLEVKALPFPHAEHTAGQLAVNLTMFHDYVFVRPIDGAYWSLSYELGFYLAILGLFMAGQIRRIEWFCWFWIAMTVVFHINQRWIPHPLHYLTVINSYGHLFAAGIALYRLHAGGFTWTRVLVVPAAAAVAAVTGTWTDFAAVSLCLLLVTAATLGWLDWLCNRYLLWFGAISYPLYLIHEVVGWSFLYRLYGAGVEPAVAMPLVLGAILLISEALHRWVEMPAMMSIRRRYKSGATGRIAAFSTARGTS